MRDEDTEITMLNPPHPGGLVRDNVEACGWTATEAARRLGIGRQALSRLLNGRSAISPSMALALERIGWSNASFWMRLQAAWELARERMKQAA
ncbi:MAG: HigA family addiction module antitoxin [Gammaproteobacteria bacterium]|nr:HigA family addiction module antitoxin [Gammaproteobacteria bacterium]